MVQPAKKRAATRKKWRVGALGLGHWYSCFGLARALVDYPRAELVAVAWPNGPQREEFAKTFGIDSHPDYRTLLDRSDIDIVHIAPPVAEIPGCTIAAAGAGKHIVLGKPMAMTTVQADDMVAAVEEAGVKCAAMQGIARVRSRPLKERLDAGIIGKIVVMHATSRWSIAEDWYRSGRPGWFADPARVPGGAFMDEGIYAIDELRWLAASEVEQVEAKMANLVHGDIEVEDWGLATFTFANGVVATLEAAWTVNSPRKSGPSPKQNGTVRLEIVGTRGEVVQERLRRPGLAVLGAGAHGWVLECPAEEPFGPRAPQPLGHLIDCLESGRDPVASIQEARRSFFVALAAYDSAWKQRPVTLSW
jgi:predicted dehydrogenase